MEAATVRSFLRLRSSTHIPSTVECARNGSSVGVILAHLIGTDCDFSWRWKWTWVSTCPARDRSWGTVRICHLPVRTKMRHERHSLTTSARFRHSDKPKRNHDMAKRSTARALLSEYADDPPDSQATGQWGDWCLPSALTIPTCCSALSCSPAT
jgi:hypothetical protein